MNKPETSELHLRTTFSSHMLLVQVYIRDGASQRHRGTAGDPRLHHQRVRVAAQRGTQTLLIEGKNNIYTLLCTNLIFTIDLNNNFLLSISIDSTVILIP